MAANVQPLALPPPREPFLDWPRILAFFGYAYLLRVPLLLIAAIAFLTNAGLFHGTGESLFSGIYDVASSGATDAFDYFLVFLRFTVLTLITVVFGTALTVTTRNIASAGGVRFHLQQIPRTRGVELGYAVAPFALCSTIVIGTVCRAAHREIALFGAVAGLAVFLLLIGVFKITEAAIQRVIVILFFVGSFTGLGFAAIRPHAGSVLAVVVIAATLARLFPVVDGFWSWALSFIPGDGAGYFEPPSGGQRRLLNRHVTAAKQLTIALVLYVVFFFLKYKGTSGHAFGTFPVLPTLATLLVLATLLCWLVAGVTFFLDRYRVPILIPLCIYAVVTMGFPQSDHFYRALPAKKAAKRFPASAALRAHLREPIVVAAATGGGIQAAAWMTRVLRGLQKDTQAPIGSKLAPGHYDLAQSVRLISAVSGGSIGTIDFLSTYAPNNSDDRGPCTRAVTASTLDDDCVVAAAQASSLDEVAFAMAYQDLLLNIAPFLKGIDIDSASRPALRLVNGRGILADRGDYLEQSFKRISGISAIDSRPATLNEWEDLNKKGDMPGVILNATIAETGERLLLATTEIDSGEGGHERSAPGRVDFHDRYPNYDIGIATAARLSATYPYVTPASRLFYGDVYASSNHVIDGGYTDNYGVASLIEWLDSGLRRLENENAMPEKGILILEIRSSPETAVEQEESHRGFLFQLYHPITTLYNVRATGQFSRDQTEIGLLEDRWRDKTKICNIPFEYPADPSEVEPLSWHLTGGNIAALDHAWTVMEKSESVNQVKQYLAGGRLTCN